MKVVVTGGAGFLGRTIYRRSIEEGHVPIPLAMENEDASGLDNVIRGDITVPSSFHFPPCDAVVHCAGILESSHPSDELLLKVNFEGTKAVYEEAVRAGANKIVFISTISALGPQGSRQRPMTEDIEPRPMDQYGRSKLMAERYLRKLSKKDGTSITILRPSVLYGPGMNLNSSGMRTFTSIRKGVMPLVGNGGTTFNMLFSENLAQAVTLVLSNCRGFHIYHVSEEPYTQARVIEAIEKQMGRKGHRRYPKFLLWLMTFLSEMTSPFFKGPPPLSWTKYHALTSDIWTMSSDLIRSELEFKESVSLEEGIERTCKYYGW